jgi:hypothetical protein
MDNQAGIAVRRRTRAEIDQIVAEFAGSGLDRSEFCRRRGIGRGSLNRYLTRVSKPAENCTGNGELVPVELVGAQSVTDGDAGCGLAVVLSHGRRIEVEAGFDAPTLERLVILLEKM